MAVYEDNDWFTVAAVCLKITTGSLWLLFAVADEGLNYVPVVFNTSLYRVLDIL